MSKAYLKIKYYIYENHCQTYYFFNRKSNQVVLAQLVQKRSEYVFN